MNFMIYFLSINIISFIICMIDKYKSVHNKYRVSEALLLFLSFIGGAFGMGISMKIFHHKTKKIKFKLVYIACFVWILIFVYYFFNI